MFQSVESSAQAGFFGQSYMNWFLFLLFFVFAWGFVLSLHSYVGRTI